MSNIKQFFDKDGNDIFPVTHASAVFDDEGRSIIDLQVEVSDARGESNCLNDRLDNLNSQLEQHTNDLSILNAEKINVLDFGAKGDGVTDDTQSIKDAIAYAQGHASKTIFLPNTEASYLISDTINFYRVNVECPATIKVGFHGIGVLAGSSSTLATNHTIYINQISHTDYAEGDISVRVQGSKRMKFTFGSMKKLQIYADGSKTINSSVAYCQFDLIGNIDTLEILGENKGWINENTFYKGKIQNVIIDGDYNHNKNVFFDSCLEGGKIIINKGSCNKFINIRNESIQSIYFAPGTHHNIVELSYYSSAGNMADYGTVTDYGISNRVIDPEDCFASVEFLNVDAYNCKLLEGVNPDITINEDSFVLNSWRDAIVVDIPYEYAKRIHVCTDSDKGSRFRISTLDSDKNVLSSNYVLCMGATWDDDDHCLSIGVNNKIPFQVVGSGIQDGVDIAYIRIVITTGNQTVAFKRVTMTVRCEPKYLPLINMAKPRINYNKLFPSNE